MTSSDVCSVSPFPPHHIIPATDASSSARVAWLWWIDLVWFDAFTTPRTAPAAPDSTSCEAMSVMVDICGAHTPHVHFCSEHSQALPYQVPDTTVRWIAGKYSHNYTRGFIIHAIKIILVRTAICMQLCGGQGVSMTHYCTRSFTVTSHETRHSAYDNNQHATHHTLITPWCPSTLGFAFADSGTVHVLVQSVPRVYLHNCVHKLINTLFKIYRVSSVHSTVVRHMQSV